MSEYEIALSYEERLELKREIKLLHRHYVQHRLNKCFPIYFVIAFALAIFLAGLTELILQIVLIVNSGPLYFVGHGIWGGVISFIYGFMCLVLSKRAFSKLLLPHFFDISPIFNYQSKS